MSFTKSSFKFYKSEVTVITVIVDQLLLTVSVCAVCFCSIVSEFKGIVQHFTNTLLEIYITLMFIRVSKYVWLILA